MNFSDRTLRASHVASLVQSTCDCKFRKGKEGKGESTTMTYFSFRKDLCCHAIGEPPGSCDIPLLEGTLEPELTQWKTT